MAIDEVVNDIIGKNCCVKLDFANGYTIERYRKHKSHKNRVIVSLRGEPQLHVRTQKAVDELLGTNYETYIKTVVLSNDSETGFVNLKPADRRHQIEASLGLSILDASGKVTSKLLSNINNNIKEVKAKIEACTGKIEASKDILKDLKRNATQFEAEAEEASASLQGVMQDHRSMRLNSPKLETRLPSDNSTLPDHIHKEKNNLQRLEGSLKQIRERRHVEPTTWRGQRHQQLGQWRKQIATDHHTGLIAFFRAIRTSILLFLLNIFRGTLGVFRISGRSQGPTTVPKYAQEAAVPSLLQDIENSKLHLHNLGAQENKMAIHAAIDQAQKACKALQPQVTSMQRNAETYRALVETEQSSLQFLRSEHDALATEFDAISTDRELFEFWSLALGKRTRYATSTSLSGSIARSTANFRDLILSKSLSELSPLLSQVLTVLYDDTRHVNMATGMLRSLLDSDSADAANESLSGSVLNSTLASNKRSGGNYNKRSSGERKRFDLALYFTQLQLEQTKCTHRAHYILVDEVLDNLDRAGQAAVIRWFNFMSQTLAERIIVITHSQSLVEGDHGESSSKAFVLEAKMGQEGTKLFAQGSEIGRD